ncbi:MAG: hypothetical protein AAGD28_11930 [Bacteroidota bacterium]
MRIVRTKKNTVEPSELDLKYYIWSFLMMVKTVQICLSPDSKALDYLLIGAFGFFILTNFYNLKEQINMFLLVYFTDLTDWFAGFVLAGSTGSRILFLDIFMGWISLNIIFQFIQAKKPRKFYLSPIFIFLTVFWLSNFMMGIVLRNGGSVIGEARFYFMSIFLFGLVTLLHDDFNQHLRKFFKIVCLASFNIAFCVLMLVTFQVSLETDGLVTDVSRFNPGNDLTGLLVFGLLIAIIDLQNKTDFHLFKIRKDLLVMIYLGILFLAGVRTMLLVTMLVVGYFFIISGKFSFIKKFFAAVAIILAGLIFIQLDSAKKLLETQSKYVKIIQATANGDPTANTAGWRLKMWEVFMNRLTEDNQRMIVGRPFGDEQIDIRELNWYWGTKKISHVDNSMAHNDFITMSMTNGLVFVLLLMIACGMYILKALVYAKKERPYKYETLILGWMLLIQCIMSFFNASLNHYGFTITLWVYLGMLAAQYNLNKETKPIEDDNKGRKKSKNIHRDPVLQSGGVH